MARKTTAIVSIRGAIRLVASRNRPDVQTVRTYTRRVIITNCLPADPPTFAKPFDLATWQEATDWLYWTGTTKILGRVYHLAAWTFDHSWPYNYPMVWAGAGASMDTPPGPRSESAAVAAWLWYGPSREYTVAARLIRTYDLQDQPLRIST